MKIAMLHGPRDLRIEDHPLDTENLKPNDIWVQTEITAFKIGTDRGKYEGAETDTGSTPVYPRTMGDSNLGTVRGVGSDVTRFRVGDRVVSREFHQSDYVVNEWGKGGAVVKVPDGVDRDDAVWAHLYTLSGFCYRKANFQPGENVAVVGIGVLGLGAVALGPLYGARVVALANSPLRLEMARRIGAHAGFLSDDPDLEAKLDAFTLGAGIDLVILAANPWPAYRTAMEIVRPSGRVSIVSLLGRGEPPLDFNPLAIKWFYRKGISLVSINGTAPYLYPSEAENRVSAERTCEHTLSLMADGRLEPKLLVTHRFHYSEMFKAYEMAYRREKSMLGVIFDWRDAHP